MIERYFNFWTMINFLHLISRNFSKWECDRKPKLTWEQGYEQGAAACLWSFDFFLLIQVCLYLFQLLVFCKKSQDKQINSPSSYSCMSGSVNHYSYKNMRPGSVVSVLTTRFHVKIIKTPVLKLLTKILNTNLIEFKLLQLLLTNADIILQLFVWQSIKYWYAQWTGSRWPFNVILRLNV